MKSKRVSKFVDEAMSKAEIDFGPPEPNDPGPYEVLKEERGWMVLARTNEGEQFCLCTEEHIANAMRDMCNNAFAFGLTMGVSKKVTIGEDRIERLRTAARLSVMGYASNNPDAAEIAAKCAEGGCRFAISEISGE